MVDKKKTASVLLKALGKTKKDQLKVLYPKSSPGKVPKKPSPKITKSKNVSKGSHTRGKVMGKGDDFLSKRRTLSGVPDSSRIAKSGANIAAIAFGTGYGVRSLKGSYDRHKSAKAEAQKGADDLISKQKKQKEKRRDGMTKSHWDSLPVKVKTDYRKKPRAPKKTFNSKGK